MDNSGQKLEQLVKVVEDVLLPRGFTVEPRKRIFENGVQIAELDLLISGVLSSTRIDWLIECRDRPSDGKAPVSWIEQLVGRRTRLNLNKVTAVSTTGFAPAAMEYAEREGIELRTVDEVTSAEIQGWFLAQTLTLQHNIGDLKHAQINIAEADDADSAAIRELFKNFTNEAKIFFGTDDNRPVSMLEIWQDVINQAKELTNGVAPNGPAIRKTVHVNYTNPASRFKLVINGKDIHITYIDFTADISIEISEVPISSITKYETLPNQGVLAESVNFEVNIGGKVVELAIHKIADQKGNTIAVTKRNRD